MFNTRFWLAVLLVMIATCVSFEFIVRIFRPDIGETCAGATCGTGKIWFDKVKCNADSANMSECLDGTKLYTSDDHSKDTIIRCKGNKLTIINHSL